MTSNKPSVLRRLIWATTLAIGFGTLWFVLLLIGEAPMEVWLGPERDRPPQESIVVRSDGAPLIRRSERGGRNGSLRELDGRAASDAQGTQLLERPGWLHTMARWSEFDLFLFLFESDFPSAWENRLRLFVDDEHKDLKWYFVHDGQRDGAGYFVGYDGSDARRVGYIGRSDFSSDPNPPDDPFPVRYDVMRSAPRWSSARIHFVRGKVRDEGLITKRVPSRLVYVPSQNHVFAVDLSTRLVRTVFEAPDTIESLDIIEAPAEAPNHPFGDGTLLVRTTRRIYLFNREHALLRTFPIPSETDRLDPALWYEVGDGRAWAEFHRPWVCDDDQVLEPRMLYQIGPDGTITSRAELLLQSGSWKWHKRRDATVFRWALPVPVILPFVEPFMVILNDREPSYASAAASMRRNSWPALTMIVGLSSLLAAAAWRRARAFALSKPERIAWVVFVFLTGVPGYIGYLLHRRWPLRQECPRCEAKVPWDRGACAACGKPFPSAAVEGTEIFC
ncbi:MAG TPA: hypothetical protein VND64_04930 [Pirellulales bacterium]|nr:hypothetical protein [Pirellulales bacterium]